MDRAWQSTFHKGCKELNETEHTFNFGFPGSSAVKNPPAMQEMQAGDWFDPWVRKIPWRKKMATYSSILAWKIPMDREEPGRLQPRGSDITEHTHTHKYAHCARVYLWSFYLVPLTCISIFVPILHSFDDYRFAI